MTSIRLLLLASTAAAVLAAPAAALAQQTDTAQLEEIIVTSSKRAERLQDVPVSVTAVTADVLERNNVRELGDLVKLSPGLVDQLRQPAGQLSASTCAASAPSRTASPSSPTSRWSSTTCRSASRPPPSRT
jgi:iron complex outermembrane receptor protein